MRELIDRLVNAGFRHTMDAAGIAVYEVHSGVFSLQVLHDHMVGTLALNLAYGWPGGNPMPYRPWRRRLEGPGHIVAEALFFLNVIEPTGVGGD
jgi:hypothetical protein